MAIPKVVEKLKLALERSRHPSTAERVSAMYELGSLCSVDQRRGYKAAEEPDGVPGAIYRRALSRLGSTLADTLEPQEVRCAAIDALAGTGSSQAVTWVASSLDDGDPEVRAVAHEALLMMFPLEMGARRVLIERGDQEAVDLLMEQLGSEWGENTRVGAATEVSLLADDAVPIDPRAVPLLITAVGEAETFDLAYAAMHALGCLGDPVAIPTLLDVMTAPRDWKEAGVAEARSAIRMIVNFGGDPAERCLIEQLPRFPAAAAAALGDEGSAQTIPLLTQLSEDETQTEETRIAAREAVARIRARIAR
jgi:HEAT repeat protein